MLRLLATLMVIGTMSACSPRAHLRDNTGLSLKRVLALQNAERPRDKLAPLTAQDAKIIMANHMAGHAKAGPTSRASSNTSTSGKSSVGSREVDLAAPPKASIRRRE